MRLIDADKVPPLSDLSGCDYEGGEYQAYKSGAEYGRGLVDDAPTVDPESLRPTAKWEKSFDGKSIVCTRCRHAFSKKGLWCRKYCPECGARMVNYSD